jgi:3-hydroxybutyryl-CoA dehydratase
MFYEDFVVGSKQTSFGRTVTEADIVIFAGMTGANNPLFLDEEFLRKSSFRHRISPGLLTLSIATGLTYQLPGGPFGEGFVAILGMSFRASKPVFAGDTLNVEVLVKDKLPPKEGNWRITLQMKVTNQKGDQVLNVDGNFLVKERTIIVQSSDFLP